MGRMRMLRALTLAILAPAVVHACSTTAAPEPAVTPEPVVTPEPPAPIDRASQETDIVEAVFRYQFENNSSGVPVERIKYLFIARGPNGRLQQDPSAELLARFAGHAPPVVPLSSAFPDMWMGVKNVHDHGRGILFRLSDVQWIDDDTVEIEGGHHYGSRNGSGNTYRVERTEGRWVVVDSKHQWQS